MIAVIYMANTITHEWNQIYITFNISMLVIVLSVILLYGLEAYREKTMKSAAGNSIQVLSIVCVIYLIAIMCIIFNKYEAVGIIDFIAVLAGAFLPFIIRGCYDKSIINFPHLVERFELLVIITFDEVIVGIAHYFHIGGFDMIPILIFGIVITMFGFYVIQVHNLMEHYREERSLRLMFSHYFIVISINLITVAFELIYGGEVNHYYAAILVILALVVFYVSVMANYKYYKEDVKLTKKDIGLMIASTIIGATIVLLFIDSIYGFSIGTLVITAGNFAVLLKKNIELKNKHIN